MERHSIFPTPCSQSIDPHILTHASQPTHPDPRIPHAHACSACRCLHRLHTDHLLIRHALPRLASQPVPHATFSPFPALLASIMPGCPPLLHGFASSRHSLCCSPWLCSMFDFRQLIVRAFFHRRFAYLSTGARREAGGRHRQMGTMTRGVRRGEATEATGRNVCARAET